MTKNSLRLFILAVIVAGAGWFLLKYEASKQKITFLNGEEEYESEEEEAGEKATIAGAMAYYGSIKGDMKTGEVNPEDVYKVYSQLAKQPKNKMGSWLNWQDIGPDNVGGRARAIVIDKDNSDVIYAGGVSGGVWKSINGGSNWHRIGTKEVANINVTTMIQTADGSLYYGTGELGFVSSGVNGDGNSGFVGRGVFKSTDGGETFTQLKQTDPGTWTQNSAWSNVNILAADPNDPNRIYAGNNGGFYMSTDGGTTWKKITVGLSVCKDIHVSKDGQTIYAAVTNGNPGSVYQLFRSDDRGESFKKLGSGTVPSAASCSYVIALSPTNPNLVYLSSASSATLGLEAVYRSDDKGETWEVIAKGGNGFNPLAAQGYYDHCIVVDPKNEDRIIIGGLNLWEGKKVAGKYEWTQLSTWQPEFYDVSNTWRNPYYVHADQHYLVFDNKSTPNLYVASDGGVSKSTDFTYASKPTFFNADYGFNTVQFYGIGVSAYNKTEVIGGSQDNGVIRVDQGGLTSLNGTDIKAGDGGFCEISKIQPNLYFGEYVNGDIQRSFNRGDGTNAWSKFFDSHVPTDPNRYPFIAIFTLWESLNDQTSPDTAIFVDFDNKHVKGETINVRSRNGYDIPVKLTADLEIGDTVKTKDIIQSKFYVGAYNGIYMTREALVPGVTPEFFLIANIPGFVPHDIKYTQDGNTIFVSGAEGNSGVVYRISGLSGKKFRYTKVPPPTNEVFVPDSFGITKTRVFTVPSQIVTGIAIDENDNNHLIATLGNYGYPNHVYRSKNAMDSMPTFTNITANLPAFPVYDALISMDNANDYMLATEFGVYSSRNGGTSWSEENEGMERVPTFMLRQMRFKDWSGPTFYAATHGRGVFMSETLVSGIEEQKEKAKLTLNVNLYPNPASDYAKVNVNLPSNAQVEISVMDLQGKVVGTYSYARQQAGDHTYDLGTANLKQGTYFVKVKADAAEKTTKMLIIR